MIGLQQYGGSSGMVATDDDTVPGCHTPTAHWAAPFLLATRRARPRRRRSGRPPPPPPVPGRPGARPGLSTARMSYAASTAYCAASASSGSSKPHSVSVPSTPSSASSADAAPRLLAAERVAPGQLPGDAGRQVVAAPGVRRRLGPGTAHAPDPRGWPRRICGEPPHRPSTTAGCRSWPFSRWLWERPCEALGGRMLFGEQGNPV